MKITKYQNPSGTKVIDTDRGLRLKLPGESGPMWTPDMYAAKAKGLRLSPDPLPQQRPLAFKPQTNPQDFNFSISEHDLNLLQQMKQMEQRKFNTLR